MPVVAHSVQVVVTVGMFAATAILALYCDLLRYRWFRQAAGTQAQRSRRPELVAPQSNGRRSRLAVALKQGRRPLSAAAQAAIARGAQPRRALLPEGLQDSGAVARLMGGGATINGLVVLLRPIPTSSASGAIQTAVAETIRELLEPGEFAAPLPGGEYLLICPSKRGSGAQQRLERFQDQIHDIRLRALAEHRLSYTWGAVECSALSLEEALLRARQNLRSAPRKTPSRELASHVRRAAV
jgi:hypothetical protein